MWRFFLIEVSVHTTTQNRNSRNVHTYTDQDFAQNPKIIRTEFGEKPQQFNNYFHKSNLKQSLQTD